ncbi:MAG: hypothetical protein M3N43_13425 [Actinomycetota bacterium]|nr:hypothetical protein [Actinomycetota bacterium]
MPYRVQFVDAISATPTIRLNLNNDTPWRIHKEGTDLPPPRLRRAMAGSLLADGMTVPSAAYDNRVVTLSLVLYRDTTAEAAASALQDLAQELDRPGGNLLLWQPDTDAPVFFRTLRSDFGSVRWEPAEKRAVVTLYAEPFAYGLKETQSPVTVNNDPAAGSNGLFLDVSSVKGDVETPLCLSLPGTSINTTGGRQGAIAVRRRGTPSSAPFVLQCEAMTVGTNTTLQANDAVMSGSSNNYLRCTFTSASLQARATMATFPAAAGVDVRGTYRVYLRYRKTVSGDVITARILAVADSQTVTNDTVTLPSGTDIRYVDLGLLPWPLGPDPGDDGYSRTALAVKGYSLQIDAGRTSGSGNLDFDCLLFVPADDRFAVVKWPINPSTTVIVDSTRDMVYALGTVGEVRSTEFPQITGGLPMVSPGQTNRITFIRDVGSTASGGDDKTGSTAVTSYYWPRYLYARPAST